MTATLPRPAAKKSRKPFERFIRIAGDSLVITVAAKRFEYTVSTIPTEGFDGVAFRLDKADGSEHYNVFLAANGQDDICDCMGFSAHSKCKHRDGLKALLLRGKLEAVEPFAG